MLVIDDIDSWITFPTTSSPHGSGRLKSRSTSRENMNYKNPISHTRHLSSLHSKYSLPTTLLEFHHGSRFSLDQWCQLLPGSSQRSGLHPPPIFTFESIALAKSTYSAKIARPTFAKKMTASMGYATHINNIFFFSSDDIPTTTFFNHIQFDTVDRGAIICPAAFQDGDGVYKCQKHGSYSMYDPCWCSCPGRLFIHFWQTHLLCSMADLIRSF